MGACASAIEGVFDPEDRPLKKFERPHFRSGFVDDYDVDTSQQLGHGAFGVVARCTEKATGKQWAVKMLNHRHMGARDKDEVYREVIIQRMLGRALHTVHLHAVYKDEDLFYLVEELCEGGTVLERLAQKHQEADGVVDEELVAGIMRQIVRFVCHCHAHHVVFRDVKPSQFMFLGREDDSPIKGTDFGFAFHLSEGTPPLQRLVGSPAFMAPEVLEQRYGLPADVWACGVAAYQMLTGHMPFSARNYLRSHGKGEDERRSTGERNDLLFKDIKRGVPEFDAATWAQYSPQAFDFVRALLVRDPAIRPTAEAALRHPWLALETAQPGARRSSSAAARGTAVGATVMQRLQRFSSLTHFKQLVMSGIARKLESQLPEEQRRLQAQYMDHVHRLFEQLNVSHDGLLTAKELSAGLRASGYEVSDDEMAQLVAALDFHGMGGLDLEEFEAALMDWRTITSVPRDAWDKAALEEFRGMGHGGDGRLTSADIKGALPATMDQTERENDANETLLAAGVADDGVLSEKEFLAFAGPEVEPLLIYEPRTSLDLRRSLDAGVEPHGGGL